MATDLILHIGRRAKVKVATLAEASKAYELARDESCEGASTFPHGIITKNGETVAHVSYNAKVWEDDPCRRDWKPGAVPLYNPYEQVAA